MPAALHSSVRQLGTRRRWLRSGAFRWDRKFADSPLEEAGFELSVPHDTTKVSRPLISPQPGFRKRVSEEPGLCRLVGGGEWIRTSSTEDAPCPSSSSIANVPTFPKLA